eukprot:CAMPEP_0182458998 /NCGR_PEP_ID=MMETSP1319-20130603/4222_1 /TAXON_ID=172717 /ORGANISM="Bolidomonas pacifica, Strain RCC208" /LENGTH=388 /DNA_ID=CAMNT_0024657807 /DNA_START=26 /DNA_END=1189 /DNA_ORIENTATION=-
MTRFYKPGRQETDYHEYGELAARRALADACIPYEKVEKAAAAYCYGDSCCSQAALYGLGTTGIPIHNVNNNCASGSSAMALARDWVLAGSECVLALGFEKMERGSLGIKYHDRTPPLQRHMETMFEINDELGASPAAAWMFGSAGREHMRLYGTTEEQIAKIAYKNHKHSVNNPFSQFRDEYSLQQIMDAPQIFPPLTKLQCCPTSDGGAAAILASEEFVIANGLQGQAVELVGCSMTSDFNSTFDSRSSIKSVGSEMTERACQDAYRQAGITPADIDVLELHDCFAANELITYEALGLCPIGSAGQFIDRDAFTYGGEGPVVNPSGGLISKGHPLGATGLAQCAEICWQLRGEAAARQVENARIGLTHNLGLGGAAVVSVYKRPDEW